MQAIDWNVELWKKPRTCEDRMRHIERAGRVCYKSEDRMTTESSERFLANVVGRGHLSVMEHGNIILKPSVSTYLWLTKAVDNGRRNGINFYLRFTRDKSNCTASGNVRAWHDFFMSMVDESARIPIELAFMAARNGVLFADVPISSLSVYDEGINGNVESCEAFDLDKEPARVRKIHETATLHFTVDRGVSHELVRHRTLSFSQESTRYCNYSKDKFGKEITVIKPSYVAENTALFPAWFVGCVGAEHAYFSMLDAGATAQEARTVLPNSLKTEVVVSGHYDDWLKFLRLRTAADAHPDIRKAAIKAGQLLFDLDREIFAEYGRKGGDAQ